MAKTAAEFVLHAQHACALDSTTLPPGTTAAAAALEIVNEAGRLLYGAWPWKFRERPPARMNFAAPISIANGTWTESSKTLTKTGAFASYTFAPGDEVEITDGTGATEGFYPIASKTSSDAIVLVDSIGSSADGQVDIDGSIEFPYVALPSDFGELIEITADGLTVDFTMTDFEEIARMRDGAVVPVGFMYWGAIVQPAQVLQTSAMGNPRLEIYPAPLTAQVAALSIWYRAAWRELTSTTHYPAIPVWCEVLLIEYVRAVAEGYMNRNADDDGILPVVQLTDRIDALERSRVFTRATEKDMLVQPSYGVAGAGLIGEQCSPFSSVVRTQDHYQQSTPFVY